MRVVIALSGLATLATAFPAMRDDPEIMARALAGFTTSIPNGQHDVAKYKDIFKRVSDAKNPLSISKDETNCGPVPCPVFNAEDQYVSTTGQYAYQSPAVADIRGPCPGLNAAANHGYLPRSGIATIEQTIAGLGAAYNLGPIVTAALAAYAVAIDGNILEGVWSIGGPLPQDPLQKGLFGTGQGLSYSHNNYEGDSSIGRSDAYINHGDAHSLNITKFEEVYAVGKPNNRYTLDKFRQRFGNVQQFSIENNPYYFTGFFSTIVVVPAAYNFVINLMSNHSAAEPSGYLDGYNFKSFFGVTGEPGSFVWQKGQERIPNNWYRRPSYNPYEGEGVVGDVLIGYAAYPKNFKLGGNTGKVNTFTGVNLNNFTGGAYDISTLFKGNNFGCFAFQLLQNGLPDFTKSGVGKLAAVLGLVDKYLTPLTEKLDCPQLQKFDQGLFNDYPGRNYNPKGKDTNY